VSSAPFAFDSALLRLAASHVPAGIETPVMRWRKLARMLNPPMSVKCSRASFQTVASALADYADANGGSCYPSVRRLAYDTGLHERTVQRALSAIESRGLLRRDARGGRGRATEYDLICPPKPAGKGDTPPAGEAVENVVKGDSWFQQRVARVSPQDRQEDRQ
jgi:hypothetical protein